MRWQRAVRHALRFGIASVLLAAAAGKLVDIQGFVKILETYQTLPDRILLPAALAIALAELALALWLFSGRGLRLAASATAAMHFAYALFAAVSILRGLRLANCGCFGVFWPRPLGWSTVLEDLALVAASFALAVLARRL